MLIRFAKKEHFNLNYVLKQKQIYYENLSENLFNDI